jgi:lipoprotein signal peptidase
MKKKVKNEIMLYCGVLSSIAGAIGAVKDLIDRFMPAKRVVSVMSKSFRLEEIVPPPPPPPPNSYFWLIIALALIVIGVIAIIVSIIRRRNNG